MELVVSFFQMFVCDVGVDLSCGDGAVPEHFLD